MEPFRLHILGCGSALPTLKHFPSMQIVECRGKLFMVDCGEGAQLQMRRLGISFARLGHVFISHLHGDHCFGLIGMVSTFGLLGRTAPLHIFAPHPLEKMLDEQMKLFCRNLGYDVVFHPVDTEKQEVIYEDRSLTVETLPLIHSIACCGFLFREKVGLPHIRRELIDMYGIPVSQINNIKAGNDYMLPDGTLISHERLTLPADPPRSYAYCSDTRYIPELANRVEHVSTLYHESTYADEHEGMAAKYLHSTARQAALVARDAGVGQLVIGHFSSRYESEEVLLNEARSVFPNTLIASEKLIIDI